MQNPLGKNKSFVAPTLIWAVYLIAMLILLGTGTRKYDSLVRTMIQWDGQHYLTIARAGYEQFPCANDPSLICGNVGWFPVYPMLARGLGSVIRPFGLDTRYAMLATSWLALWLALLLLYRLVRNRYGDNPATLTTIALLLFPSSFYFLTAFPYALYLLLALAVFSLLESKRYLACAIPAGLLAATYPSGIVIGLPMAWVLVSNWKQLSGRQRNSLIASIVAIGAGLALYGLYYWAKFGDFLLYVHFQSKPYYAHHATFPLIPIVQSLIELPAAHPVWVMLVFVIATVALLYNKKLPVSWQLYLFGILLFTPTAGTTVSYYRHIIVAFPLAVLVGTAFESRWKRWPALAWIAASVVLMLFVFLKYYKLGQLM